jgi:hypothetical protein
MDSQAYEAARPRNRISGPLWAEFILGFHFKFRIFLPILVILLLSSVLITVFS